MTKVIYKYPLQLTDYQTIEVPKSAYVLDFQYQRDILCMWADVDPSKELERYHVYIYGTGNTVEERQGVYQTTVQQGEFVWHIYFDTDFDIWFNEWCDEIGEEETDLEFEEWCEENKNAV